MLPKQERSTLLFYFFIFNKQYLLFKILNRMMVVKCFIKSTFHTITSMFIFFVFFFYLWFFLFVIKVILNFWNSIFTFMIFPALVIIWVGFVCSRMLYQSPIHITTSVFLFFFIFMCVFFIYGFAYESLKGNFKSMKSII